MIKCLAITGLIILLPVATSANPIVKPTKVVAFLLIFEICLMIEVSITTGYLVFMGLRASSVFVALLVVNLGTYYYILLPLLDSGLPIVLLEMLIVFIEALVIKLISYHSLFQADTFTPLCWRHALNAALLGNAFSYLVGEMIS